MHANEGRKSSHCPKNMFGQVMIMISLKPSVLDRLTTTENTSDLTPIGWPRDPTATKIGRPPFRPYPKDDMWLSGGQVLDSQPVREMAQFGT